MATSEDRTLLIAGLRLEDVASFLVVYRQLIGQSQVVKGYDNLEAVTQASGQRYSTVVGQLNRLLDFVLPPNNVRRQSGKHGVEALFEKRAAAGIQPTDLADLLYHRFESLDDFCQDLRADAKVVALAEQGPLVVRVGAPATLASWWLAAAFGRTDVLNTEPEGPLRVEVDMGNSYADLLPQLRLGRLDAVLAYDRSSGDGGGRSRLLGDVRFLPLGDEWRMVLITHPDEPLFLRGPTELDSGYSEAEKLAIKERDTKRRSYAHLPEIEAYRLDFRKITAPLIRVASWRQPTAILDLEAEAGRHAALKTVNWYEEALAQVRMRSGVAIVPEVFSERRRVLSFRLEPAHEFARQIGVYYHATRPADDRLGRFIVFMALYAKFVRGRREKDIPDAAGPAPDDNLNDLGFRAAWAELEFSKRGWKGLSDWVLERAGSEKSP